MHSLVQQLLQELPQELPPQPQIRRIIMMIQMIQELPPQELPKHIYFTSSVFRLRHTMQIGAVRLHGIQEKGIELCP